MTVPLSKKYKMNRKFYEMHPETQYVLNIIMGVLSSAHEMDVEHNCTGRELLEIYSPANELLQSHDFISWGSALHALISDVIEEKDLLSEASKSGVKH